MTLIAPRACCARCRRPQVVCYCAQLPTLPTRTRVLVLQHPRERGVGIGTARMAHLALPNSVLRVGVEFSTNPVVAEALAGPAPSYLLFPGAEAQDLRAHSVEQPITLVVVDGTWSQARRLVRVNARLAALPRIAFRPRRPSEYRIRKEPFDFCVSTIEALAEVLDVLEPDRAPFAALLDPFRVMVARQERFQREVASSRHARRARAPRYRSPIGARLDADWLRLVCLYGDANGWPVRDPARQDPELVHFVACRPATGEIYEAVVAPRQPLAPLTPRHLELSAERILGGCSLDRWRRSWQAFTRPGDLLVQWGGFHSALAIEAGLSLASPRLDLRGELSHSLRPAGGTLEACVARLGAPVEPLPIEGRAGRRLACLLALVRALRTSAAGGAPASGGPHPY